MRGVLAKETGSFAAKSVDKELQRDSTIHYRLVRWCEAKTRFRIPAKASVSSGENAITSRKKRSCSPALPR
jgi:hypothetical protein